MKKILSLMALLLLTVTTAWADTATVSYNNSEEVSDPEGFFTHDANGKFNVNTKFNGAEYDGITFTSGLKMEGSTKILFTTTEESTVTIVQSTWSDYTIKFDGGELSVNDAAAGTGCRIYTIENVAAGEHNITRGSGESGIFYVKAEWADAPVTKTVYFDNTATQWGQVNIWAWNDTENFTGGEWPGAEMETTETPNLFKWTTTGNPTKVIFSNNGASQTSQDGWDFVDGATYNQDGRVIIKQNFTLTFQTEKEWEEIYAYAWNDKENSGWTTNKMTKEGDDWTATVQLENEPTGVLFHNGKDGDAQEKTPDYTYVEDETYEYMQNTYTATFTTDAGWEHVYAYVWTTKDDKTTVYSEAWPGTELTANEGVYTVTINTYDDAPQKIQFNGGTNETKAGDWNFVDGKAYKYLTATPIYALTTGVTFTSGQTVDVSKDEEVVATLTYGEAGGNDFQPTKAYSIEGYTGYTAYTEGNKVNPEDQGGTFYTIVPKYDGVIDIAVIINKDKTLIVEEDGVSMGGFEKQTEKLYGIQTFNVKAGKSYKCYVSGSKLGFFGFDYKFTKPELRFKVAGLMTKWTPIDVYDADSYTFENLAAGTYQFKVIDGEDWKGIADMTEVAGGLYWDSDGNVCFKLAEEGNVTVNYKSGELFTVEGNFVAPTVALAGSMNEWSSTANVLVPAEDKKTASVTVALNVDYYQLKMIVDGSWLAKNALYELTRENSSVEHVDQAIDEGPNIAVNADVAGDYTFTWEYATNTLTVTYPEKLPTVALAGTMNDWSASANVLVPAQDKQTASVTVNLTADDYEFKMVVDGHWLAKNETYVLHRGWRTVDNVDQEISMGPNIKLQADVAGDYTFTWEYATNKLTVTFPTGDLTLYEDADNTDALTEWDGTSANVTLTRTLKTGMWNTFAAPFSIEIPTGWTVKELTATSYDANENKVTMSFGDAEGIEAGKPYLVKVNTNDDLQLDVFSPVTVDKTVRAVTSLDYINFIPTLGKTTIEGDASSVLFLAAENKLKNPDEMPTNMKGFRAYFLLKDDAANARVFNLDLGEGETTSISEKLKVDSEQFAPAAVMYDLQGRRVQNAAQKGVYIMNGRKVVKK